MNTLPVIQKMKTRDGPKYITEQLRYVGETQPYHLQNENNFRIPRTITTNMQIFTVYYQMKFNMKQTLMYLKEKLCIGLKVMF